MGRLLSREIREIVLFAFLAWSLFFMSVASGSQNDLPFKSIQCARQIGAFLAKWEHPRGWKRELISANGDEIYRSATLTIGTFLELRRSFENEVTARRYSVEGFTKVSWQPRTCNERVSTQISHYDLQAVNKEFSDAYLRKLVRENKAGLIYAWSPHMPLSIDFMKYAQRAAARSGSSFSWSWTPTRIQLSWRT